MENEVKEAEIDLLQLARTLWEKVTYIIVVTVIFGLIGAVGSALFLTPIYEATAKMIVNTRKDENQNVTNDQLNSAKNLVDTYAIIIRSRDVLNQVIGELSLPESYNQLLGCVSVHAVNDTQVMEVVIHHKDPAVAYAVAQKILEITPNIIVETVEAGSVKAVEQAYVNPEPVSPSVLKNGMLLGLIGFILTCAIIVVVFMTDNTYKTDMDLQNDLQLPILGVIPTIESCSTSSRYKYGYPAKGRK